MPNGWYPVSGLDVVLINRTEQRYPRLEWDHSWDTLWAVQFTGARGCAPLGELQYAPSTAKDPIAELIHKTQAVLVGDPMQGTAGASVLYVDFAKKTGFACGVFSVYGFTGGTAEVLLDLSLGADIPEELRKKTDPFYFDLQTTWIDASGIRPPDRPMQSFHFQFPEVDSLVISSRPLHYDAHWPPKNSLDCVVIALARPRNNDTWVALWKKEDAIKP